jgi:large subunit ribosomal protein L21
MFAIIHNGGKQYKVAAGDVLKLEKIAATAGEEIVFDKVLMVVNGGDVQIGKPFLNNGKVSAKVIGHGRHDKIRIVKFRRRKNSRRQAGHRQHFTEVQITAINEH